MKFKNKKIIFIYILKKYISIILIWSWSWSFYKKYCLYWSFIIMKFNTNTVNQKTTSVVVDVDKWQFVKSKGYNLQEIVDDAFNTILEIDDLGNADLLAEKKNLENSILSKMNLEKNLEKEYLAGKKELDKIGRKKEFFGRLSNFTIQDINKMIRYLIIKKYAEEKLVKGTYAVWSVVQITA